MNDIFDDMNAKEVAKHYSSEYGENEDTMRIVFLTSFERLLLKLSSIFSQYLSRVGIEYNDNDGTLQFYYVLYSVEINVMGSFCLNTLLSYQPLYTWLLQVCNVYFISTCQYKYSSPTSPFSNSSNWYFDPTQHSRRETIEVST